MKELTSEGVGVEKQSAQLLTKEMEETQWDEKIFTPKTGIGLRNITFWYNCKFLVFEPVMSTETLRSFSTKLERMR